MHAQDQHLPQALHGRHIVLSLLARLPVRVRDHVPLGLGLQGGMAEATLLRADQGLGRAGGAMSVAPPLGMSRPLPEVQR